MEEKRRRGKPTRVGGGNVSQTAVRLDTEEAILLLKAANKTKMSQSEVIREAIKKYAESLNIKV